MPPDEKIKKLVSALGVISEMSLIFYRNALKAGASYEEALKLSQAFIAAYIFGSGAAKDKPGN